MITDTEFITATDRALAAIGAALDAALAVSDVDLDWNLNDGILEIECDDGSKLIVNRHLPNREIWVAARTGGFHFRPRDGAWRDTRSGDELGAALACARAARRRGSRRAAAARRTCRCSSRAAAPSTPRSTPFEPRAAPLRVAVLGLQHGGPLAERPPRDGVSREKRFDEAQNRGEWLSSTRCATSCATT